MLGGVVHGIGWYWAREQTTHWVMADDPKKLFVENFGDLSVFKSFDPVSKEIGGELFLVKVSDSSAVALRRVHTGKLVTADLLLREAR